MDWIQEVSEHQQRRYQTEIDDAQLGLSEIAKGRRFETGSDRGMVDVTDARKRQLLARVETYKRLIGRLRPTPH